MTTLRLSAALVAFALLLRADFDPKLWQFRRAVELHGMAGIVRLKPDAVLYKGSKDELADVRLIRDGGETPYALDVLRPRGEPGQIPARVVNQEVVSGDRLQLTLELRFSLPHDRVTLKTAKQDFLQRVQVEASQDGKEWAMVLRDGVIYDVSQGAHPASFIERGISRLNAALCARYDPWLERSEGGSLRLSNAFWTE